MTHTHHFSILKIALFFICCLLQPFTVQTLTTAKYVLVFQADGMGPEHIRAGGMYINGAEGTMVFESFPNQTTMTHNNATNTTTDSAASASAMATGRKVHNLVISQALPGDGSDLITALELHQALGRSTGLVTESYLTDASTAAYGAHVSSRYDYGSITNDYLNQTQPNILFGGGGSGFDTTMATNKGYHLVTNRTALLNLNTETHLKIAGSFGTGLIPTDGTVGRDPTLPTLPEMTEQALASLDNNNAGFFVFIEDEDTDERSHANDAANLMLALTEFNNAVQTGLDWVNNTANASDWTNTLLLVVADHETGGLRVTETSPSTGVVPAVTWNTTGHTQTAVRIFAHGQGASQITGTQIDNTAIFSIISPASVSATATPTASASVTPTISHTPATHLQQHQNRVVVYPNPGRDVIHFLFHLDKTASIKITLYNLNGEKIVTLTESLLAGKGQLIQLNSNNIAPGIYIARVLKNGKELEKMKIIVTH